MPSVTPSIIFLGLLFITTVLGLFVHQAVHYFFGTLFGGTPFVSKYWLKIIPCEIDFETPDEMTDLQVRITGGAVMVFPFFLLLSAVLAPVFVFYSIDITNQLFAAWLLLSVLFVGASGISWLDKIAWADPEKWRRYTQGEPIQRELSD